MFLSVPGTQVNTVSSSGLGPDPLQRYCTKRYMKSNTGMAISTESTDFYNACFQMILYSISAQAFSAENQLFVT